MLEIKTTATEMKIAFHRLMSKLYTAEVSMSLKISQYKLPKLNCKGKIKNRTKHSRNGGDFKR